MRDKIPNIKKYKKIAVMGGTFDPIHYGHLVAAETVRQQLCIEKVIFIPTGYPPHKNNELVANNEHRYLMTVLATAGNPFFDVSRMEIEREGATYTIDTIKELRHMCHEDTEIYFITGADAINYILSWKDAEKLLTMCKFVAVTRPGYCKEKLFKTISNIEKKINVKLDFVQIPALNISSTDIRNRVAAQKTIKYLLPDNVLQYIIKSDIYKIGLFEDDYFYSICRTLYSELSPSRFSHTIGVAKEAVKLAKTYGADEKTAYTAALLHDCAKEMPNDEKIAFCKECGFIPDKDLTAQPDLLHGMVAAYKAKRDFGITDKEIFNAIFYHTVGRPNMSLIEKIIYIADYIEPTRTPFDGLKEVRKTAYENLNKAVYMCLFQTIEYNKIKGRSIYPLSFDALEYYKNV